MTANKNLELIVEELSEVLHAIRSEEMTALTERILSAEQIFVVGVGRVLLSMQAVVKRLNHLGVRAYYVGQIDEPAATEKDLLIVASNSGESLFPVAIAGKAKRIGVSIAYIGSNPDSSAGRLADCCLRIPVTSKLSVEGVISSKQPMTSLFEQVLLLVGDAIAMEILEHKGIAKENTWCCHANLE